MSSYWCYKNLQYILKNIFYTDNIDKSIETLLNKYISIFAFQIKIVPSLLFLFFHIYYYIQYIIYKFMLLKHIISFNFNISFSTLIFHQVIIILKNHEYCVMKYYDKALYHL